MTPPFRGFRPSTNPGALQIVLWIEHTYNRRRRQRGLGKLTPVEFELTFAPDHTAHAS